ncbi:hypothetical protein [Acinetobacter sp. Marseille-Q1618]|uniref:hypothetical protein n=1 Tax=Acinetobacter sp. Marseille-Q1618 TaxID=2697502 RepID=UPI00156FA108|nr:hypothetical protein [Acinetobacter sp. Marseille-Q1618]
MNKVTEGSNLKKVSILEAYRTLAREQGEASKNPDHPVNKKLIESLEAEQLELKRIRSIK